MTSKKVLEKRSDVFDDRNVSVGFAHSTNNRLFDGVGRLLRGTRVKAREIPGSHSGTRVERQSLLFDTVSQPIESDEMRIGERLADDESAVGFQNPLEFVEGSLLIGNLAKD